MADSTCIQTQGILYIEINHLRKAEPIQLYQILNKGKRLKKSKHVLFIIFLKSEAKGLGSRMTKICPIQSIDQNACKYKSAWDSFKNNNNKFENQSLWLLW